MIYYGQKPDGRPFVSSAPYCNRVYYAWDPTTHCGHWVDTNGTFTSRSWITPEMHLVKDRWMPVSVLGFDIDYTMDEGL